MKTEFKIAIQDWKDAFKVDYKIKGSMLLRRFDELLVGVSYENLPGRDEYYVFPIINNILLSDVVTGVMCPQRMLRTPFKAHKEWLPGQFNKLVTSFKFTNNEKFSLNEFLSYNKYILTKNGWGTTSQFTAIIQTLIYHKKIDYARLLIDKFYECLVLDEKLRPRQEKYRQKLDIHPHQWMENMKSELLISNQDRELIINERLIKLKLKNLQNNHLDVTEDLLWIWDDILEYHPMLRK